ncbi:MAG: cytochrome c [Chloroflexi bacterium]|nr:cytochrome c [Chloroflexota bacterium]
MAEIARVEVYVDGQSTPYKVLEKGPFQVQIDPADFAEGDHFLQVYVYYTNGDFHQYLYRFSVARKNQTFAGYLNRAPVGAPIEVILIDPSEETVAAARPNPFVHGILPVLLFLLIAGVAAWFAYMGDKSVKDYVENIEPIAAAAAASESQGEAKAGGGAVDGATIYAQNCASCHGPDGQGQGDVFPALAGNQNLADLEMVMDVVLHGRPGTAMVPWGQQLSDEEIAAVINYILNSWGNNFGTVTPEDIAARR